MNADFLPPESISISDDRYRILGLLHSGTENMYEGRISIHDNWVAGEGLRVIVPLSAIWKIERIVIRSEQPALRLVTNNGDMTP